ncbi:MAG: hypothetical protein K8S14_00750 [Actinomycetia bacterium]|nr:hypothetical protein [Actinomycetes bacterium]
MEELTITDISYEDVEFSIDEAIEFQNPDPEGSFNWDDILGKGEMELNKFLTQRYDINYLDGVYLFSWDEVPGNDSNELIEFLRQKISFNWVDTAKIEKIDKGKAIRISSLENHFSLILNDEKTKVNLKIDDDRIYELMVKTENRKLNIYEKAILEKIDDNTIKLTTSENSLFLMLDDEGSKLSLKINDDKVDEILAKKKNGKLNIYQERLDEFLSHSPNQIIYLVINDTTPFKLDDGDSESLIENVCEELGFKGQILDINRNTQLSSTKTEYKIYLRVDTEDFKQYNKNACDTFIELKLLKGFQAITTHGKVSFSDISNEVLNFTPKKMDLRVFTKLLDNDNTTYICFSELIYKKFTEMLTEDEHDFVQIDISDYVEEIENIISSQLFGNICTDEHRLEIRNEMKNMRYQNYRGVAMLWNTIENILRKIALNFGYIDDSATLPNYLEHLTSSANSHRRLSEETKCLIIAIDRNKQAHGTLTRSHFDHKYLAILWMKAIRDIYHDWCRFQSIDLCFDKMALDLGNQTKNELWKFYEHRKKRESINKITVIEHPGDWASNVHMEIIFEDVDAKQKVNYNFNVNLIDNLISSG